MLLIIFHVGAVYVGALAAQLEYIDIWRAIVVAVISYIVMFLLSLVLLPLIAVPLLGQLMGVVVLTLGSAFAGKMVLACDWKPAWVLGITAGVLDAIASFALSGCTSV